VTPVADHSAMTTQEGLPATGSREPITTFAEATHDLSRHFVYLYRDPRSNSVRYVGKATTQPSARLQRPETHQKCGSSCRVRPWIEELRDVGLSPVIEVVNCLDADEAAVVEASLISAFWSHADDGATGLLNKIHGSGEVFRPLGLPRSMSRRRFEPLLTREELAGRPGPVIVVNLSIHDFEEEGQVRPGAGTYSRVTDRRVADRIRGWWQFGAQVEAWQSGEFPAPKAIVGIAGPPSRKWVYGALDVTRSMVMNMEWASGGLWRFPVRDDVRVDAFNLRGRRVAPRSFGPLTTANGRAFGSVRAHHFDTV
jgi:hypothetical protein